VLDPDLGPWTMIAIATPIVWILAQISSHVLEAPGQRHKPRRPDAAPALPLAPGKRPVTADPGARPPS
jgi:peptidoglycan/LPS O-acetylase OafA/YrhL